MSGIIPGGSLPLRLAFEHLRAESEQPEPDPAAPTTRPRPGETLSAAGRAIARLAPLLIADADRGRALEQAVLTQLAGPAATDANAVASELRGSLERSGLFYEAHLCAWSSGAFALEDLRREPQARIGARPAAMPADEPARPPGEASDTAPPTLPVPRELERLVREQLATLETRTAVVPLVIWPGQGATLAITDEPEAGEDAAGAEPPGEQSWRATLRVSLPRLGEVEFALSVRDELVRVGARARSAASREELAARADDLHGALRRNAMVLERLEVAGDER